MVHYHQVSYYFNYCFIIKFEFRLGTKLLQAQRFNDQNDSCKIMVATDAIGMGLNLYVNYSCFIRFNLLIFIFIGVLNVSYSIVSLNHN